MTKDETLRLALEALEKLFGIPDMLTGENSGDVAVWRLGGSYRTQQAIHAIKEALAQPEREWIGLTEEDVWNLLRFRKYNTVTIEIARAVEAKLKERNT